MRRRISMFVLLFSCGIATVTLAAAPPAESQQPRSPEDSAKMFTVANDLKWTQVLAEPTIAQPVNLNFDERGRLWVVEYRQYPYPQGLKVLSRDKHWRVQYDGVPQPPPHHQVGRDRITIHEDTTGDGQFDRHKTFVDGLNLATAVEIGRGGAWVLNPPYLLFYPDKNRDDVPDGDPEVHLSGFGLSDSHSVVNSLTWGPDGWLYAAQGSTVHGQVKVAGSNAKPVHSLGQLIWRYHPQRRKYEIFAEGGGNAFGVEVDSKGRIFSGHNGGDTRGFHYVQGAYYKKGFTKHGPLSNPYAFGFFPAMRHHDAQRFTHALVIYEGAALPQAYHGRLFGVEPLQSQIVQSDISSLGSTFQTKDIDRPVKSADQWFRPVDIKVGLDGAIYVADFFERYPSHREHYEGKVFNTDGRVYRLGPKGQKFGPTFDLATLTSGQLIEKLRDPNRRVRRTALRVLGDRRDKAIVPKLNTLLASSQGQFALECLWALNLSGGLDQATTIAALNHEDPHVRLWAVRLAGDDGKVSLELADRLSFLALQEPHVEVRSQLACTARRLPVRDAFPILLNLMIQDDDADDPHLPLLLWWAVESHCSQDPPAVLAYFRDELLWRRKLVQEAILPRLMRRFAATGKREDLAFCSQLFDLAPDDNARRQLLTGFEQAYEGRSLANLPPKLAEQIRSLGGGSLALRVRGGDADATAEALKIIRDEQAKLPLRLELIEVFGQVKHPDAVDVLLTVAENSSTEEVRAPALASLTSYDNATIADRTLTALQQGLPPEANLVALTLLSSRPTWAAKLLAAVDAGTLPAETITEPTLRRILLHDDPAIAKSVAKHWGEVRGATTEEMRQRVTHLVKVATAGSGDPYHGKQLYRTRCGKCHRLFEEGGRVGPDLTSYQRDNLNSLLLNVVNPSAEIREGFETYTAFTDDGRVLTGFLADQDPHTVELRGVDGRAYTLARDTIEELKPSPRSIMPEGLLDKLDEQQVRDLLAYLRSRQPLND